MGCTSSHLPLDYQYATALPNTADESKGIGSTYRCIGFENQLKARPKEGIVNLWDIFREGLKKSPNGGFLGHREVVDGVAGDYVWQTYSECEEIMKAYSRAIKKYDLLSVTDGTVLCTDGTPMKTMGHFIKNCPAAVLSQYGAWRLNGTIVTLYDTLGPEAIATIVHEAELKTVLCTTASGMMLLNCLHTDKERFATIKNLVIVGPVSEEMKQLGQSQNVQIYSFDALIEEGRHLPEITESEPKADDICMICYTSGTTGVPKGALLSHGNMVAVSGPVTDYILTLGGFTNEDSHISYLPMAHVFEHFVQCGVTYFGARIGFYQGDTTKLLSDIKALHPSVFASVPRLFGRIVDSIYSKARKTGGVKEALFFKAMADKKWVLTHENRLDHMLWDPLVFKGIKKAVGFDRIRFMVTGSAPISDDCLLACRVIFGCPVIQGLGLSETGGGICCSYMQDNSTVGHCGGVICCAEARLISVPEMGYSIKDTIHGKEVNDDGVVINPGIPCCGRGEACYRGYNIIRGYYKRDTINADTFDSEGWYHSGDIALLRPNGAIQIIDRKKDIFKLAQGEYISPDKITAVYQTCPLVASLFVYGDSLQSYLVGIVVPDEMELRRELRQRGMDEADMDFGTMCQQQSVRAVVFEKMAKTANESKLMGFEKIKNIYCDSEVWTVENGMLTPTLKLKRDCSKKHYKDVIDALYKEGMMQIANKA